MRKRLIQIPSGKGYDSEGVVGEILSSLRCDKCRHWTFLPDTQPARRGEGYCEANTVVKMNLITSPDFFCSKWESK